MADTYINIGIVNTDETIYDLSRYIDKRTISFSIEPRVMQVVRTLDGVDHVASEGTRQRIRFSFNPMTTDQAKGLIAKLFATPTLTMTYNGIVPPKNGAYYDMRLTDASAEYLANCRFTSQHWYQLGEIEMVEL